MSLASQAMQCSNLLLCGRGDDTAKVSRAELLLLSKNSPQECKNVLIDRLFSIGIRSFRYIR